MSPYSVCTRNKILLRHFPDVVDCAFFRSEFDCVFASEVMNVVCCAVYTIESSAVEVVFRYCSRETVGHAFGFYFYYHAFSISNILAVVLNMNYIEEGYIVECRDVFALVDCYGYCKTLGGIKNITVFFKILIFLCYLLLVSCISCNRIIDFIAGSSVNKLELVRICVSVIIQVKEKTFLSKCSACYTHFLIISKSVNGKRVFGIVFAYIACVCYGIICVFSIVVTFDILEVMTYSYKSLFIILCIPEYDNVILVICRKNKSLEGCVGYVSGDNHEFFRDNVITGYSVFFFMKHFFCTDFKIFYGIVYFFLCYIVERVFITAFDIHLYGMAGCFGVVACSVAFV